MAASAMAAHTSSSHGQLLVSSNDAEVIEAALASLRSRVGHERRAGASALRGAVDLSSREMSPETFTQFEDALFKRVFTQVHSNEIHEKLGAVAAMHSLIDVSSGEAETKIIKFANTLSDLIRTSTDPALLEAVARALGHLAHASVVPNTDYVEFEVRHLFSLLLASCCDSLPSHVLFAVARLPHTAIYSLFTLPPPPRFDAYALRSTVGLNGYMRSRTTATAALLHASFSASWRSMPRLSSSLSREIFLPEYGRC